MEERTKKDDVLELVVELGISYSTAYKMVTGKLPRLIRRYVEAAQIRSKRKNTTPLRELGEMLGLGDGGQ